MSQRSRETWTIAVVSLMSSVTPDEKCHAFVGTRSPHSSQAYCVDSPQFVPASPAPGLSFTDCHGPGARRADCSSADDTG
jgi:hypothetical protein